MIRIDGISVSTSVLSYSKEYEDGYYFELGAVRSLLNILLPSVTPPPPTPQNLDDRSLVHNLDVSA